jgi:hypothetical protein
MIVSPDLITKFCEAIAVAEGYGKPGPTQDANNPGNLTDDGDVGCGCIETHGCHGAKITKYRTAADGWAALHKKVSRIFRGASHVYTLDMTIAQVAEKWCGDANWGFNVAQCLQVTPTNTLLDLINKDSKSQDLKWPNA